MFANAYQSGFMSIFYSVGSNPLQLWDKQVKNGHIRRVVDDEVRSLVLEISGTNVATTYITCPIKPRLSLGIKLPFLVMIIKNMKKYFTFEIQILDDKDMHRRFRVSNFQSTTKVRPFCTTMPIGLSTGWNQVQFNLADFTKRAYGSTYLETTRVQIHANVRIRRIYFSDVLYSDDELPNEYKLFLPTPGTQTVSRPSQAKKESIQEKPEEKKPSVSETPEIPPSQEETPSAAPPSPVGMHIPEGEDAPTTTPTEEPTESEMVAEPPSEPIEGETTVEPTSGDVTTVEPTTTELTSEPMEGEPLVEGVEVTGEPTPEGEAPGEPAPQEGEAEAPAAAEEAVAEAPVEEAPTQEEAPPPEEAPPEEAPPAEPEAGVTEEATPSEKVEEAAPAPPEEAVAEEPPSEAAAEEAA
ncbi:fibrous sheath CABYR-binding protein-like [Zophobas morio]|uniref:fibrous sheath CABYR-binding protein-like n=1 Tax=Zophobas morio TaxID=2755281 RepID=UPI0030827725